MPLKSNLVLHATLLASIAVCTAGQAIAQPQVAPVGRYSCHLTVLLSLENGDWVTKPQDRTVEVVVTPDWKFEGATTWSHGDGDSHIFVYVDQFNRQNVGSTMIGPIGQSSGGLCKRAD